MLDEDQSRAPANNIATQPRVVIDLESAKRIRKTAYDSRLQALRAAQHALEVAKMMDVIIKAAS